MANFMLNTEAIGRSPGCRRPDLAHERGYLNVPAVYEAFSDDGPFHRLTDADVHRRMIFASFYYGFVAVALLAALVWR